DEVAAHLHERLTEAAEDGVQLHLQRPEVTGSDEEMLFNGAYLVADRPRFEHQLEALAEEYREFGVELELTGPWPPYNFVPVELRCVDELELVVSNRPGVDVTQDAVLRHAAVVEELMSRSRGVLPAQFGPPFGDEDDFATAIRTKADELSRGLSRVRGCVEFGL